MRTAKSWPTEAVTFDVVWAEVQSLREKLDLNDVLNRRTVRAWHTDLVKTLALCDEHDLNDYRVQVSTFGSRVGAEAPYDTLFIEASGWDCTVWLGTVTKERLKQPVSVARIYTLNHPEVPGTRRLGRWLYLHNTPKS